MTATVRAQLGRLRPQRAPRSLVVRTGLAAAAIGAIASGLALAGPATAAPVTFAASANDGMDGMDMGGQATPQVSQSSAGSGHSMDMGDSGTSVAGLSAGGGQQWKHPEQIAAASLVRIDTSVNVSVAVHAAHLHNFTFNLQAPDSTSTGFVVNPQGAVVTSFPALKESDAQLSPYIVAAINEGFVRSGFLPAFSNPADLYKKTHVPKDREVREGNLNPSLDVRLQSCYDRSNPESHCALFIRPQIKVTAITPNAVAGGTDALKAWSDDKVAVVTTSDKYTPLTLTFAPGESGSDYWMVAVMDGKPMTITGKLTSDKAKPLSDKDLDTLWDKLGPAGAGSPLVSRTGAVVGMLGRASDGYEVVPADHLARDSGRSGITLAAGPLDTQFRDGMLFFESQEYRSAHAQLEPVVKATGGQIVPAAMDAEAKAKAGTPADMTDAANSHTTMAGDDGSGRGWWWILGIAALAVLIAGGLWLTRQHWLPLLNRSEPSPPGTSEPAGAVTTTNVPGPISAPGPVIGGTVTSGGSPMADRTGPTRTITPPAAEPGTTRTPGGGGRATTILATPDLSAPPTVPAPASVPAAAPAPAARDNSFCAQCGSQLSPGDRFCYSCGTPLR